MTMSIVGPQVKPPTVGCCDGGGFTSTVKPPIGTCDADSVEIGEKKSSQKARTLATAILLIGGAMLGYGHRNQISKGLNALKEKFTAFATTGKMGELVTKGKSMLASLKDKIFVKTVAAPVATAVATAAETIVK